MSDVPKNILLVDDHKVVRDGLKYYFKGQTTYQIQDEAENGKVALEKLAEHKYDLVITDISMPEMDGIELITAINSSFPNQKILVLSMIGETPYIKKLITPAVNGYLLKNAEKEEIILAIDTILNKNENYFSSEVNGQLSMT
jgi:DNA-binding NarL/FixJ family response regulator